MIQLIGEFLIGCFGIFRIAGIMNSDQQYSKVDCRCGNSNVPEAQLEHLTKEVTAYLLTMILIPPYHPTPIRYDIISVREI